MDNIRAAFVGFGEVNTPRDIIEGKCAAAVQALAPLGWDLTVAGPVSDDPAYAQADAALAALSGREYDVIIVCLAGWIPPHAVVRVIDRYRHVPMVLWGLTGWMENGRLVTTADQAGTTALRRTMQELGYTFRYVYSMVGKQPPVGKIEAFARAARAARTLRDARVGTLGYRDMLLYGTGYDGPSLRRVFGVEVESCEMLEMVRRMPEADDPAVQAIVAYCRENWRFENDVPADVLARGARYYLALKEKALERKFAAMTVLDVDGMKKLEGFPPAMVLMLLCDELGIHAIPENDIPGAVTQMIVGALTGQAAPYMEFYEFMEDRVLIGVPDFIPGRAALGPVTVRATAFGQLTGSVLNVSKVKDGPVTLVRLIPTGDRYALHVATGTAVQPRPWEEAGWAPPAPQLPSLEVILDTAVEDFAQQVSSQHTIVAYGDITDELTCYARLTGIDIVG